MVYLMLADGFEEIEALVFADILRRAEIDIKTVSVSDKKTVTGAHGIEVISDEFISNIKGISDAIVLPGGMPGTINLSKSEKLAELLKVYNEKAKYIGAICAAPSILGQLGLLKSKKSTCYPSFEDKLTGASYSADRVVTDGNIITSKGPGTSHDFALKFVEILKGDKKAEEIRKSMLYDD